MKSLVPLITLVVLLVLTPTVGFAQMSDDLKGQLASQLEEFKSSDQLEVKQRALMAIGYGADRASQRELGLLKKDDSSAIRIAAGVGLMVAGDRTATSFVVSELLKSEYLPGVLRHTISGLPVKHQITVFKGLIKRGDDKVKADVFRHLNYGHDDIYQLIGDALLDRVEATRQIAFETIAHAPRLAALEFADKMVKSRVIKVRALGVELAAKVVAFHGPSEEAKAIFQAVLNNRSSDVWMPAAKQLVQMNDSRGADKLVSGLSSLGAVERIELVSFLLENDAKLSSSEAVKKLAESAEEVDEKMLFYELAATSGEQSIVEHLGEMFASETFDDRLVAARALGRTQSDKARELLERGLFEGHNDIRKYSAAGLGHIASESSLPVLQRAANGERLKEIKLLAIDAIGKIHSPQSVQILRFLVANNDVDIKMSVVKSLRSLGLVECVNPLEILVRERHLEIQWQAFLGLLELDRAVAMRHARTVLRSPPENFVNDIYGLKNISEHTEFWKYLATHPSDRVRMSAQMLLSALGENALAVYRLSLDDRDVATDVKSEFTWRIGQGKQSDDVAFLSQRVSQVTDDDLRQTMLWTLAGYQSVDAMTILEKYFKAGSHIERAIAAYGLASIN